MRRGWLGVKYISPMGQDVGKEKIMQRGQVVRLMANSGEIERVIVEDLGSVLLVCKSSELQEAEKQGRNPISIGFAKGDLVSDKR